MNETGLLGGRLRLLQPAKGYRVAIDPVLLAAAVADGPGHLLDVGSGTGAVSLCAAIRLPEVTVTGLESDPAALALARRSAALNGLEQRVRFVEGTVEHMAQVLEGASFDQAVTNPPYHEASTFDARSTLKAGAHGESLPLAAWLAACLRRLRSGGRLVLIHRAERLPAILAALDGPVGGLRILPCWPKATATAAVRVIVAGRKGSRAPARLLRGLVLHGPEGHFTGAAEAILRSGQPLEFAE